MLPNFTEVAIYSRTSQLVNGSPVYQNVLTLLPMQLTVNTIPDKTKKLTLTNKKKRD